MPLAETGSEATPGGDHLRPSLFTLTAVKRIADSWPYWLIAISIAGWTYEFWRGWHGTR